MDNREHEPRATRALTTGELAVILASRFTLTNGIEFVGSRILVKLVSCIRDEIATRDLLRKNNTL